MRIKVVSDLHLEFSDVTIPNNENADVLVLSGDIMISESFNDNPRSEHEFIHQNSIRYREFLTRCSNAYPHVVYVAGNHEFYHGKFYKGIELLRKECQTYGNVHFLECDSVMIDDVLFVGGTIWTDLNKHDPLTVHAVGSYMNDYQIIQNDERNKRLTPNDTYQRHITTIEYIKGILEANKDKKTVVVGHHCPTKQSCHPRYKSEHLVNGGYSSDLSELILDNPQIKLWTHGHTHDVFDYMVGETRVVCNPRGYHTTLDVEQTGWNPNTIFEI